ncbi:small heat shock protein [Moniliophthora roreri]|uniref:SHSP domain-containing protein n=1 Tax=Moniliophthora roreri TaxID=221103 RepID=A0A0W0FLQ5_MONRR|nr:small heat shock protein [Moniliophthora roreri]
MTPKSEPSSPTNAASLAHSPSQLPMSASDQRLVLQLATNLAHRLLEQKQHAELERRKSQLRNGTSCWMPRVDIFDDPDSDNIVALFELPGVRREDARVNVIDGKLVVEGERIMRFKRSFRPTGGWVESDQRTVDDEGNVNHSAAQVPRSVAELRYGRFRREFPLPDGITPSDVHVLLENGMLHIQWPRQKPTGTSPKRAFNGLIDESASARKRPKASGSGSAL